MRLPEKSAFTLAEFGAQFNVDESTVIDWWRQKLINFCVRWKAPTTKVQWWESRADEPWATGPSYCSRGQLLRLPRAAVDKVLFEEAGGTKTAKPEEAAATSSDTITLFLPGWMQVSQGDLLISRWERDRFIAESQRLPVVIKGLQESERSSDLSKTDDPALGRWPWGDHDTKLLRHLAAAAHEWWSTYDPDNPSTAPTNADVSGWLIDKHKVSKRMAEAMAQILRANGLPGGRRR